MKAAMIYQPKDGNLPLQEHYRRMDFKNVNLKDFAFDGVDFSYANFRGANLDNTKFHECILYNTNFKGANITDKTVIRSNGMRSPLDAKAHFDDKQKELLGLTKESGKIR